MSHLEVKLKYAPYSFSKISTHDSCNRKFLYAYIEKPPKSKKDMTALFKGGAVHSILEHYPERSPHKLAYKYQYIADKFLDTETGKKYIHRDGVNESKIGLDINFNPCAYSSSDTMFRGIVDYVCIIDNVLHIIDWKTGKYKEPKYQSYEQLLFYSIYFFEKYSQIDKIVISYIYVEHSDHENAIELSREYLGNYKKELLKLIVDVEKDKTFPKNESVLCDWCDYKEFCRNDNRTPEEIELINLD